MDPWFRHAGYEDQATPFSAEVLKKIAVELKEVLGPRFRPKELTPYQIVNLSGLVCQKLKILGEDTLGLDKHVLAESDMETLIRFLSEPDAFPAEDHMSRFSDGRSYLADDILGKYARGADFLGREHLDDEREFWDRIKAPDRVVSKGVLGHSL